MTIEESASAMLGGLVDKVSAEQGFTATQTNAVKLVMQKTANNIAVSKTMTKDQILMVANLPKAPSDVKALFESGQMQFGEARKYIRRIVTSGSGIIEMFTDAINQVSGLTNISKGRLEEMELMMIRRIELRYDNGAGIAVGTAQLAPIAVTDDPALVNGELELKIGGKVKGRWPVNSFFEPDSTVIGSPANGLNLKAPISWNYNEKIQISLITPDGVAFTSGNGTIDILQATIIGSNATPRD